jgi:hypothetical protein
MALTARRLIAIADKGDKPIASSSIRDVSGNRAKRIAEELSHPAVILTAAALAPSMAMNWPFIAAPPSYVMSPKRFTTPIVNTKAKAGDEPNTIRAAAGAKPLA